MDHFIIKNNVACLLWGFFLVFFYAFHTTQDALYSIKFTKIALDCIFFKGIFSKPTKNINTCREQIRKSKIFKYCMYLNIMPGPYTLTENKHVLDLNRQRKNQTSGELF